MPMELMIERLNARQRTVCQDTISPNTFFMLVGDALMSQEPLSLVRMGDGEKYLFQHCQKGLPDVTVKPPNSPFNEQWLRGLGCYDIPNAEMVRRLKIAAEESTYYAPNIMGIQMESFSVADLFAYRKRYVDNWFVRTWSRKLQDQLLRASRQVLFINADKKAHATFTNRMLSLGLMADCIEMSTWRQADSVIEQAKSNVAPLVLFAGGPASKHIAPAIATTGCKPKVVLDLGHAATMEWL